MYGRVWAVLSPVAVLVIDTGKYIGVYHPDDLVRIDYNGYWDGDQHGACRIRQEYPVWRPMPSLRALKRRARWYNRDIWKNRRNGSLPQGAHGRGRYADLTKEYQMMEFNL